MNAPRALRAPPRVGMISLGCAKALVDSERILSALRARGYAFAADYAGADVVIVNTCGFLDSARAESLEAIADAMAAHGRVVVTGCLAHEAPSLLERFPGLVAVTAPAQTDDALAQVVAAVEAAAPRPAEPFLDLVPADVRLTPGHYAFLKIAEGCNHRCSFCIIPRLRGRLVSRRPDAILKEAERRVANGVRELIVISQDTSAYGRDLGHARFGGRRAHITDLARALGELGVWVRLHYVYPYPHVDELVALMAEGLILPYLDIPFQHASPRILRTMRRPADEMRTLERIRAWRAQVPDLVIRSTFIVGFPGETEDDFRHLLDWVAEAGIDRAGCFAFEAVEGADASALPGAVPEEVKEERRQRFMAHAAAVSAARLKTRIGRVLEVIVDEVDGRGGADARSKGDSPGVDGRVLLRRARHARPGDILSVRIEDADAHDLYGVPC
ncbi:MAG: 30S ribosomal protein S12 methylthiotransferase RimO [Sphingomonadaceae bacterium]|uniref:30S ribosomal protein S12 methylthiotransferase RimO n=1 Tax=Thermaurantiacus sp. TaxID=2820283 RepID=UPI00298F21E3|nr:30S ribosomal protein S12 methylthiotransferase RimO [Thermaurantiacus sp.]MCS6987215.1 30S ribosomal protein S12 methylthiotransferase RimO [Sphingomonadaceae bacterium]MDW8414435.1 30S ribosomal protein S12 methylthiotransferase RimO [Thermaurantiacus sp.]